MAESIIVVPCFNEAARLPVDRFVEFVEAQPDWGIIFVNDGSSDSTLDVLRALVDRDPKRFVLLDQQPNRGKAEAVRAGMLEAFARDPVYAGYFDADLSTPLVEATRLRDVLRARPACQLAMGARVQLLGREIERSTLRHYLGRVFATVASQSLKLAVYDTQCGAKLFRATPFVRACFEAPFVSSWIFDVEVIARMTSSREAASLPAMEELIYELPLQAWTDVAGSKVRPFDFVRAMFEMARIYRRYLAGSNRSSRDDPSG
jgi:glycosyltransferase involved in cell wall biosynthesis